jgi:methionyl-tRNA formyltransferase
MGTPEFAVPSLRALHDRGHDVVAVFTQPDRPAGRGHTEHASAVKRFALERGLRVEQPQKLRDPAVIDTLRALTPQVIAVAAYGKILPKTLLELPPLGAINVHGSLLPRHRGAAPIQRAILAGDTTTGITIMQMNEGMDTGDILLQEASAIRRDDTAATLGERLADIGARLLVAALDRVESGALVARPQNDAEATLAPMVKKEEGEIDWRRSAVEIERAVRAYTPWPSAYTKLDGKLLKVHRAAVIDAASQADPGTVVSARGDDLEVATGAGLLRLLEVQLEGKRRLGAREFLAGQTLRAGDTLG